MRPQWFRKRPLLVEAEQYKAGETLSSRFTGAVPETFTYCEDGSLLIRTPEGVMRAQPGDWIIRGIKGEFYACRQDIFQETYQRVLLSEEPDADADRV